MNLNASGHACLNPLAQSTDRLRIDSTRAACGTQLLDFGVHCRGSLAAGRLMAEVCLAGLGSAEIVPGSHAVFPGPAVAIRTDQPVAACLASQYAGWQISGESFFAMGSGPMRAAAAKEQLFEQIGITETAEHAVGVLESSKLPPTAVCEQIASDCGVPADRLTLLVARTASLSGTIQVVSRSVETALHKMHEIGFELDRLVSGYGVAPLPPVAADDLVGIGRTNDAVLYGAEVTLWVTGDDPSLEELGPQIPSCSSPAFGQPFADIFEDHNRDFYKIDPLLFSPAVVTLNNLDSGRQFRFGETRPDVLRNSFYGP
ncbi:MAG: methenyltetrahydromethanopterin cyclohydrolase [Planctomycetota bacterium]|nr:methenyltetrahydromethanopterin cyclohydrolase [Planctomycetota bacterium]